MFQIRIWLFLSLLAVLQTRQTLCRDNLPPSPNPPGGLRPTQVPQFVILGFDDNSESPGDAAMDSNLASYPSHDRTSGVEVLLCPLALPSVCEKYRLTGMPYSVAHDCNRIDTRLRNGDKVVARTFGMSLVHQFSL